MSHIIRNNFTSGEISPAIQMRPELNAYQAGLKKCENFLVKAQGGIVSRPGMKFCDTVYTGVPTDNAAPKRIIPFVFSEGEAYILMVSANTIYFYRDGAPVDDGAGGDYSVTLPYTLTDDEIWSIDYAQSADIMTWAIAGRAPLAVERYGNNNWNVRTITFVPSAETPTNLVLTASGTGYGGFDKDYRYVVTAMYYSGEESAATADVTITHASLSTTGGIKLAWAHPTPTDVWYYRIYKSASGDSGTFGWIGNANKQQFIDFNFAPLVTDSPPERLVKPVNPGCVTYYQQRQVFGNLKLAPLTFVASKIANPELFRQSQPIQPDDAFSVTASTPEFNAIQFLVPLNSLLILTSGSEIRSTEGESEVFTPSTSGTRILSQNGCSNVKPVLAGSTLLYVQSSKQRVRSLRVAEQGGYVGVDVTLLARHIFENERIQQVTFSKNPYGVMWCATEKGNLLSMTYLEGQKVTAWHRQSLASSSADETRAVSVATIPEDFEDVPYFLTRRQYGTSYTWSLERSKDLDEVYGLDMWTEKTSVTETDTFTGLEHLAGEDVLVVADGYRIDGLSVDANGTLTLGWKVKQLYVGLGYTCTAELLPVVSPDLPRSSPKGVTEIIAHVNRTRGLWAGAIPDNESLLEMWEARPRSVGDSYGLPEDYTGGLHVGLGGSWAVDACLRIEQRDPFYSEILAVEYHLDV